LEKAHASRKANKIDPNEAPEKKLKRLAAKRVPAAIARLRQVGNLAGYGITASQAEKVYNTLEAELKAVGTKFRQAVEGKGSSSVPDTFDI
jgi:NAD/NADP transhydrogenase beta subunit